MHVAFSVIPSNMGIDQIPNWNSLGGEEREVGEKKNLGHAHSTESSCM